MYKLETKNDMQYSTTPFIIDVEASGFGCDSYPIEVAVVLNDGKKFCSLIIPAQEWTHWDVEAEKVHKLTREMLNTYGKPIATVADQLNEILAGMVLYSDAWVVDKPWLTTLFRQAQKPMSFSIRPLEAILSDTQMEIWHETKNRLISELNLTRHRASNDALIIQKTFMQTLATTRS
jgi:hypothetical protein